MHTVTPAAPGHLACVLGWAIALWALAAPAAFAACSGSSPNIVCTSTPGVISLNTTTASGANPQTASVYPSSNVVSGLVGTVSSVQVRLNGLSHSWLHSMDMVLVSPGGQSFVFWSDIGTAGNSAPNAISNQTLTISDAAANALPQGTTAGGSTYRPRNYETLANSQDLFPAPAGFSASASNSAAPLGSATFASRFNGVTPNGTWQLYIALDSSGPDTGSLQSWDLIFATAVASAPTITTVTSSANPIQIPLVGNSTGTLTATVTASGSPVTLGAVSFFDGAVALATNVPLNSSGVAALSFNTTGATPPVLAEGLHAINVTYSGEAGFGASSGSLTQIVDRATQINGNTFCNTGPIALPQATGTASVYPSRIFVSGLAGTTQSVVMDLRGFTNPATNDVNLLLVSPTGQRFVPFAYVSDSAAATSNANIRLDDLAANVLPTTGAVATGIYRPSHGLNGTVVSPATFFAPAPAGPYSSAAPTGASTFSSTFAGASPNGAWTLFAVNGIGGGPAGPRGLSNGWCLTLGTSADATTTTTPSVSPSPSAVGQAATVSAQVVNAVTGAPVNAQGAITFSEGTTTLAGPSPVNASGVASFVKSDFPQGAHFIDAAYSGAPGAFVASSGQVLHYVDAATTQPSTNRFCNTSPLTFPNAIASGSPYPTRINVSGLGGTLTRVAVVLNGLSHAAPDDIDLMLTGPTGTSLVVLSDVGGFNAVSGLNLVLDSTASTSLPDTTTLTSGTFRPADFQAGADSFAAPAPTTNVFSASTSSLATVFNNGNPNGTWVLWTRNDGAGAQGGGSLSGGWCVDLTTSAPVLTIAKTHVGNFVRGQVGATYTVTVGNSGPGSTAGTLTVVDTPTPGLTVTGMAGSGWTCTVATRTCTTPAVIAANGALPPITVTVDVAANATSPQVNSVTVSGGGAAGSATANDSTLLDAPDLTLTKTAQGAPFAQGGSVTYLLSVNNITPVPAFGTTTVQDSLPAGLTVASATGPDWSCSLAQPVVCTRTTPIPANTSSVITLVANIASNAPASITNTASVSNPAESNVANNSGSATVSVATVSPDLTLGKLAQGSSFQQGGTLSYALTVNNIGTGPTTGPITVLDMIPTGLTLTAAGGANWTCVNGQPLSCTRMLPMPAGGSSAISLSANIAANAPASITNTANVSTPGESNTNNNSGSSVISVAAVGPDLTVTKTAQGNFIRGGTAGYVLTVANIGNQPTSAPYSLSDTLPTGLTAGMPSGAGWNCAASSSTVVSCTRSTALAPGASSLLNLPVAIALNAPASIINTASVAGGGEVNTGNNSGAVEVMLSLFSDGFE